ncbi:pterin binding enzyme [archaeon BMS3Abin16]|nr:pterin binding enzyme [archaeon BMS3Abin16]
MKVVVVTGRLMQSRVREVAEEFGCTVFTAPVDIASFIRPSHLQGLTGFDLIIFPGYSTIDLDAVEKSLGIKAVLGPKDLSNLGYVLENIERLVLSKTVPACVLLTSEMRKRAFTEIKQVDSAEIKSRLLKKPGNFVVGDLAVGLDFPMRVMAEIVDADTMSNSEVIERARYYVGQGADIIDIGISHKAPGRTAELMGLLRRLNVLLSVDTMDLDNLNAAIESGVDLLMSLDKELLESVQPTNTPVVIVPGRGKFNGYEEKLQALNESIALAKERGFTNIIADPILEPLGYGVSDSIAGYRELGRKGEVPLLMGVGNVTELTDADSIGINAFLAGIAMECGVSLLFTTEASHKTRGAVAELKTASNMMFLAKSRGTMPKDLGIDLLRLKEKRRVISSATSESRRVKAEPGVKKPDSLGDFTIHVEEDKLVALHLKAGRADVAVEGTSAKDICDTIIRLGLVSEMSHASYLGVELEKAEVALRTGRSYVQDETLFPY